MTTQSWSTVIDHTSDAGFRAWGLELNTKFLAAGLVQTADTGQINWTTVTRAAVSTDAGYEIYRLNDSLNATAPVYIKILYGTGGSATRPRISVQFGTGSSGAGALTGLTNTNQIVSTAVGPVSTVIAYQSYLCVTAGFVGLVWKAQAGTTGLSLAGFAFGRTVDNTGAITVTGGLFVGMLNGAGSTTAWIVNQSVRFAATAAWQTLSSSANSSGISPITFNPGNPTASTTASGNTQLYVAFMNIPDVLPCMFLGAAFLTELNEGSTASATLVGTTAHTYISVGREIGMSCTGNDPAKLGLCMIWE